MSDPRLEAESRNANPAGAWNAPAPQSTEGARISTYSGSGAASISSISAVADAQNKAAATPYEYAEDPNTRCRLGPGQLKEDSIVHFTGLGSVTVAQARDMGWMPARSQTYEQADQPRPFDRSAANSPPQDVPEELKGEILPDPKAEQTLSDLVTNTGGFENV